MVEPEPAPLPSRDEQHADLARRKRLLRRARELRLRREASAPLRDRRAESPAAARPAAPAPPNRELAAASPRKSSSHQLEVDRRDLLERAAVRPGFVQLVPKASKWCWPNDFSGSVSRRGFGGHGRFG